MIADLHHVIGNKGAAPFDEFEGCLTLANAAGACNQNAHAVNLNQYTVHTDHRRCFTVDIIN
ncbi:hypothetical protein SDC9_191319 [bioreactor metagenome]|uniref:Uncharacterized protein n=1 Tax=bioreactor metagenome TaxID=1076179 RepID=A0A645HZZ1_9ZZZZ